MRTVMLALLQDMLFIGVWSVMMLVIAQIILGLCYKKISVVDLVTDKGSDRTSLHKTSQLAGLVLTGYWFSQVIDRVKLAGDTDWTSFGLMFLCVGLLYISPQAVVNWLNRNKPSEKKDVPAS